MSQVSPPKEDVPIYNSLNYYGQGDDDKLNFPIAQGPEVMAQGVYWGDGTFQNTANPGASGSFVQYPTAQGRVDFGTGPGFGISFGAAVQDTPYTGMTTATGTHEPASVTLDGNGQITAISSVNTDIDYVLTKGTNAGGLGITNLGDITQSSGSTTLRNTTVNGTALINGNVSQSTGSTTLKGTTIDGSATINGSTTIETSFGTSANFNLRTEDSTTGRSIYFLPSVGAGNYNPASEAGNVEILGTGSVGSETLTLTTWSTTNSAVKIKPTSVEIGAGGTLATGTSNIKLDGATVHVYPTITYNDSTVQNSAYTGAGSLAGTYTSADVTIDSNGKITAISNGTSTAPNIVYSQWASNISFSSGFNSGTVLSVNLTPGTWQLIGVLVVNIGGGASFVPGGAVTNPFALCSINPSGSGTIAIGTIATPNNGATWSGGAQQIYTYVQTVVTITSNTTYNLQYSVSVDLTTGYMSIPNINPPTYLRAIQLG